MDYIIKELWWYFEIIGTGKSKLIIIIKKKKKLRYIRNLFANLLIGTHVSLTIFGACLLPVTNCNYTIFQMHLYDLQKKKKKALITYKTVCVSIYNQQNGFKII